jgi:hypothetical protein
MKSIRACIYRAELHLPTLVATRGRNFPIARLESRLMCPACGSRRVVVMFATPSEGNRNRVAQTTRKGERGMLLGLRRTYAVTCFHTAILMVSSQAAPSCDTHSLHRPSLSALVECLTDALDRIKTLETENQLLRAESCGMFLDIKALHENAGLPTSNLNEPIYCRPPRRKR